MRLLVIEDEKNILDFLKSAFEAESFSVDTATEGTKGSMLARTNDYDAVIVDYILPEKRGDEIVRDIRSSGKTTPVIMLTVQSEIKQKVNVLNSGADDYVTKPFSFEELLARVRAVLRRPKNIESEILQIDNLSIDRSKHAVKRGSKSIYLTRKEFELPEYMIKNQGKVLSRGMIMEHVWDSQGDIFSNTIETHVLNLRKKIDSHTNRKLIHTIPGRGYKLDIKR